MFTKIFRGHTENVGERHWFFWFTPNFGATHGIDAFVKRFWLGRTRHPELVRSICGRTSFSITSAPKRCIRKNLVRGRTERPRRDISPHDMTYSFPQRGDKRVPFRALIFGV